MEHYKTWQIQGRSSFKNSVNHIKNLVGRCQIGEQVNLWSVDGRIPPLSLKKRYIESCAFVNDKLVIHYQEGSYRLILKIEQY